MTNTGNTSTATINTAIQKAYKVYSFSEWKDSFPPLDIEDTLTIYADSQSRAKANYIESHPFDEYLDLRAKRYPDHDLINGRKRSVVEQESKENARIAKNIAFVMQYADNCLFYIQNGFVGNSVSFWALGGKGYTCDIDKAQKYTKQQVLDKFVGLGREEDRIWLASHIESKIKKHVDMQYLETQFCTY